MKKTKNINPSKFEKDRGVSIAWEKIPMLYTGIKHPHNPDKELVIKQFFGDKVEICWRNNRLSKMGIGKLVQKTQDGFMYKGKEIKYGKNGWVW